jgi:hypothetical protein
MARRPATREAFVLFDVLYEDGSQRSNRRVPSETLGGLDGDAPARTVIEEQDRLVAEKSGKPALAVKSIRRSPDKVSRGEQVASTARRQWIAPRASEAAGWPRMIGAGSGSLPRPSPRQDFFLRSGNETLALRLLARELALPSDRLRLFSGSPLRRLLVEAPPLHLPEDAFALHLLLQGPKCLIDVVVANENLQGNVPFMLA